MYSPNLALVGRDSILVILTLALAKSCKTEKRLPGESALK